MDLSPESPIGYNFLFFIFFIHCIFYLVESHRGYLKDGRIFEKVIEIIPQLLKLDIFVFIHDFSVAFSYSVQVLFA